MGPGPEHEEPPGHGCVLEVAEALLETACQIHGVGSRCTSDGSRQPSTVNK
ncbi:hypothetical protein SFR_1814 [Streptomyces sp. FR-008]|nr:hypothetical protein SFR_1814 [Streptomyces sp. FR-008]